MSAKSVQTWKQHNHLWHAIISIESYLIHLKSGTVIYYMRFIMIIRFCAYPILCQPERNIALHFIVNRGPTF